MPDDLIGITEAATILKLRYQRARDEATQGRLGEVKREENGRMFVSRAAVERRRDELDSLASSIPENPA